MSHLNRSLMVGALAVVALAAVRTEFPSAEDPGPPFYARLEAGFFIRDGNTVAIPFYRLPACVPPRFNLLNLFDAPRAFGCPLTVQGFETWKNGPPPVDMAPTHAEIRGAGEVPVWFVDWTELAAVKADRILTITELRSLASLRLGSAHFYQETIRPDGAVAVPTKTIVAIGVLSDGTPFHVEVSTGPGEGHVAISIR